MASTILVTRSSRITALATAAFAAAASADVWESAVEVSAVKIEIKHVTSEDLSRLQRQYAGDRGSVRYIDTSHRHAFAVLFTNKADGSRRCEIYVVSDGMSASKLADTLGHESAHCFGFVHD